jgi:hypothetical protein
MQINSSGQKTAAMTAFIRLSSEEMAIKLSLSQ